MSVSFSIEKELGTIGEASGGAVKKLRLVSWGEAPAKYDFRVWMAKPGEKEIPLRGVTMTEDDARQLCALLCEYFGKED